MFREMQREVFMVLGSVDNFTETHLNVQYIGIYFRSCVLSKERRIYIIRLKLITFYIK
jgi:hypothetical protein